MVYIVRSSLSSVNPVNIYLIWSLARSFRICRAMCAWESKKNNGSNSLSKRKSVARFTLHRCKRSFSSKLVSRWSARSGHLVRDSLLISLIKIHLAQPVAGEIEPTAEIVMDRLWSIELITCHLSRLKILSAKILGSVLTRNVFI